MGRVFGVGYVGLRRFVKKALLNFSQNLEENICDGVSSKLQLQAEGLKIY